MKTDFTITVERLRALLDYDPATGNLLWRASPNNRVRAGALAGVIGSNGYRRVMLDMVRYPAHRLVWLHVTGQWPSQQVDHINGNRADNRFENLRDVSPSANAQNQRAAKASNKSGFLGVYPARGRFCAAIWLGQAPKHLGYFDSAEAAHAAYVTAKRQMHQGCTI